MAKPRSRIRNIAEYVGVRLVAMLMHMFPVDVNLRTARLIGKIWYHLIPRHRERARAHLRLAYGGECSDAEMDRIALRSMQQMVMMAVESVFTPRLINEWTWRRYIKPRDMSDMVRLLLEDRGAIMLTGHYGNWEVLGFAMSALGFPAVAVMRPLDNPMLNRFIVDVRARRGLILLDKKGATQSADDVIERGETLCFIADQNAGRKGQFVDFFGVKASTYKSIGLLAMRHRVPIVVGYARRISDRFEYEVACNRIIFPAEWEGRDNELEWITQEYTSAIEAFVREAPEQYLWIHRRWKSRPRGEAVSPLPPELEALKR